MPVLDQRPYQSHQHQDNRADNDIQPFLGRDSHLRARPSNEMHWEYRRAVGVSQSGVCPVAAAQSSRGSSRVSHDRECVTTRVLDPPRRIRFYPILVHGEREHRGDLFQHPLQRHGVCRRRAAPRFLTVFLATFAVFFFAATLFFAFRASVFIPLSARHQGAARDSMRAPKAHRCRRQNPSRQDHRRPRSGRSARKPA